MPYPTAAPIDDIDPDTGMPYGYSDPYEPESGVDGTVFGGGMLPSDPLIDCTATHGNSMTSDVLTVLLNEMAKPLAQRVFEKTKPRHNPAMENMAIMNDAVGLSLNPGNAQLGGDGANVMCIPADKIIALWASEVQIHGKLNCIPTSPQSMIDLNFGPLNAALTPPTQVVSPGPSTPPLALLTVATTDAGSNSYPTPTGTSDDTLAFPSPSDIPYLIAQSATRTAGRAAEAAEGTLTTSVTSLASTDLQQRHAADQAKGATAEVQAATSPAIYVIIPDHVHGDGTPVVAWTGGMDCKAAVRGINYQFLFGYNRMQDILDLHQMSLDGILGS